MTACVCGAQIRKREGLWAHTDVHEIPPSFPVHKPEPKPQPKNRRWALMSAVLPGLLFVSAVLFSHATTHTGPVMVATQIIVTDHGCILSEGDVMSVSVAHNTLIGFTYLRHTGFETYKARFSPLVSRPYYYLRFQGAKPWGIWVPAGAFTRPVLRINCLGGRLGNITQPPWANNPFPDIAFPIDN